MNRSLPKLAAYAVALLSLSVVTGAMYTSWMLASLAKARASISDVPAPDALYLHALLMLPLFFLIGLLLGVMGTAITLEHPVTASGEKTEDALPTAKRGNA
ncbi:hypothetical protein OU800_21860 [Pseudomonas sp. GOM7]|uniref:hypothetical protein n=1 Tax=Pseudomonas sp. GOM7 TaxID=2998079 RepID=UPI00227A8DBA|nr:hypothetical protein [Pseudomonas sp. GOM7]WAJ37222.1 hypothetical protein OU800_21860 [Pseudomonas sp. GOM7]